ncbi:hypothetical protein SCHPADRAFT_939495 [Schizopora paradoxa]|uniref:Uncharacterized protein n=1 Tax=Schizopora paradoxa TaxID=27342 RepID=A0A0H2SCA7_9AGAM|nr:hypothetical protein SCHPADRAFT_939495 [Schizopora paradoxa]
MPQAMSKRNSLKPMNFVQESRIRRKKEKEEQAHLNDTVLKCKRLQWSRSMRDEAYGKFCATRDSLRALYAQIEFKKAELIKARSDYHEVNKIVKKHRSDVREACIKYEIPEEHYVFREAHSSDNGYDTDSVTDVATDLEDVDLEISQSGKKTDGKVSLLIVLRE